MAVPAKKPFSVPRLRLIRDGGNTPSSAAPAEASSSAAPAEASGSPNRKGDAEHQQAAPASGPREAQSAPEARFGQALPSQALRSIASDPETHHPQMTRGAGPDTTLSEGALSRTALQETARSGSVRSGSVRSESACSDAALSDAALSDASLSDAALSDASLSDAALSDAALSEAPVSNAELSDGQLVALARVGDRAAFEKLYRRHAPYVLSLAIRVQGNATDAEDIVHDAFIKVHGHLGQLRSGDSFRWWLASVAANLVRTRLRRRRLLGVLGLQTGEPIDLDLLVAEDAGPEDRVQLAQVYETLRELPVDQRLAWVLRYVEGHKLEDVAQISGCSLATAKRWIATAQGRIAGSVVKGAVVEGAATPGSSVAPGGKNG